MISRVCTFFSTKMWLPLTCINLFPEPFLTLPLNIHWNFVLKKTFASKDSKPVNWSLHFVNVFACMGLRLAKGSLEFWCYHFFPWVCKYIVFVDFHTELLLALINIILYSVQRINVYHSLEGITKSSPNIKYHLHLIHQICLMLHTYFFLHSFLFEIYADFGTCGKSELLPVPPTVVRRWEGLHFCTWWSTTDS